MSTAGGPKLHGIGRSGDSDIVLCLDTHDAASYPGEPTTNRMTIYDGNLPNYWNTTTYSSYTAVNMRTPVGRKAHKLTLDKDGSNGYYGSPNPCRLTSSPSWSNNGLDHYYSMWITTDNWSKLDGATYKYVTGSNGWPGFSATSYKCTAGGREWRFYKGFISAASNTGSGSEYFTFYKSGTYTEDMVFYIAGTMVHQNGNYAVPVVSGTRSTTDAWKDLSGHNNDGDFTNTTDTGVGNLRDENVIFPIENNYIDFDGTDDYINLGSGSSLKPTTAMTISVWVNPDSSQNTYADIGGGHWNNQGYVIQQNGASTNQYYFAYKNTSPAWVSTGTTTLTADTWQHFVITCEFGGTTKHYLNGVETISTSLSGAILYISSEDMFIGHGYTAARCFNGQIGSYTIYSTALTAQQVKQNFNSQRSRFQV
jgi:hypothetical protein